MPEIKTKRSDILRNAEVDRMLLRAEAASVKYGKQTIRFKPRMVRCLIAMLWIFGKRITEILKVKRGDMFVRKGYLYVRFTVLKKKKRKSEPIPTKTVKRITLKNPYAKHILEWANNFTKASDYIFPGHVKERTITVKNKETGKVYTYHQEPEPRMSRELAYKILKGINPSCWTHLFRHSLATEMAERGYSEEELMAWFNWDSPKVAHDYVVRGPRLLRRAAKRTW